jgi:biopolymer transport protein ExbD
MKGKRADNLSIPISRLSSPLGLRTQVSAPERRVDLLPFVDFAFIALLFAFLSSRIIFTPGVALNLPEAEASQIEGLTSSKVLTVDQGQYLYGGGIYSLETLPRAFSQNPEGIRGRVLLIRADRELALQTLVSLSDLARAAGFTRVLVAAEETADHASERRAAPLFNP